MRRLEIDCRLEYEVEGPSHFLFQIEPARVPGQEVLRESLTIEPALDKRHWTHLESGNRHFRFDADAGPVRVHYHAEVGLAPAPVGAPGPAEETVSDLPDDVLHLLTPTRYCECDELGPVAQKLFSDVPPGLPRVQAITQWIHEQVEYRLGTSDVGTTARDIFVQRSGVCRDFAHLGIALCRALNIPARFVVGYVRFEEPPPDFHALFEAWVNGRWQLFDATEMAPIDKLVRIATGRDAKDVAFATIYGPARMLSMAPEVREI